MSLILIVCALVCELVATLTGFGLAHVSHYPGWLALGLVFYLASLLAEPALALRGR